MIFAPWKRPFSMKMLPVFRPAIAPPAMNRFGTLVSNVSGFRSGAERLVVALDPGAAHQIDVRVIAGQQEHAVGRNLLTRPRR